MRLGDLLVRNAREDGEGTDFDAISHNIASITPLQIDFTHHADIPILKQWFMQN